MKLAIVLLLGICVSLGAPRAKISAKAVAPPELTFSQLEKWTKEWQKRLSLEEWHISSAIVRSSELKPDTLGNLRWNSSTKEASIRVLNPADYDLLPSEIPTDIEYTVVHELIHLQLAVLLRDPSRKVTEERVVNRIAEALFALEKGAAYHPRAGLTHLGSKDKSSSEVSRSKNP